MSDIEKKLKGLSELANGADAFADPLSDMDIEKFALSMDQMAGGMGIPGLDVFAPKEVGLYDKVIVHGFKGDYKLSFEETEEGLVIKIEE